MTRLTLILLGFIISCTGLLHAETHYNYTRIDIRTGLSESYVSDILRDSKGFLWIGTISGLNCYDRLGIQTYFKELNNPASIPGNYIHCIAEDANTNIWVGTNNGLAYLDRTTGQFTKRSNDIIYSALNIDKEIIFGGFKCIHRYNTDTDQLTKLQIEYEDERNSAYSIKSIKYNVAGEIVIAGTNGRIYIYNPKDNSFVRNEKIKIHYLFGIHCGRDGYYYLSSYKEGLYKYDSYGNLAGHWNTSNSGLTNNIISDIDEIEENKLWIATDGGGICIFDMSTESFSSISYSSEAPNSIQCKSFTRIYKDYDNNIWAGSVRKGVINIKPTFIRTFKFAPHNASGNSFGLSENTIISMYEDSDSTLWIGTDGGGINAFDPKTSTFRHFPSTKPFSITSIAGFNKESLIISIFNKGAFIFSKKDGRLSPFIIKDKATDNHFKLSGVTPSIHKISDDKFYVLSEKNYSYCPSKKSFTEMSTIPGEIYPWALNLTVVNDSLSFAIFENKIYTIDRRTDKISMFVTLEQNEPITSLCCDKNGKIWLGSNWGLSYIDPNGKKQKRVKNNLFNMVSHMVYDMDDRLWICADNQLFSYDIDHDEISVWSELDGFIPNEIIKTYQASPKGQYIYLGGTNGLVVIDRKINLPGENSISISLDKVMLNGKPLPTTTNKGGIYKLPYNYSTLSVSVYPKEKDMFRKVLFKYTVNGSKQQIIESNNRTLDLPTLSPGEYTISVSCNYKNGGWSPDIALIRIKITPPWYKSNWMTFGMILLFILTMFVTMRTITKRNKQKLKSAIEKHRQEISAKKIQFLVNISHELKTPLTLIYAPLKRLIKGLEDDNPDKDSLTDIYHQTCYMRDIINMVLDINKLDHGGFVISPSRREFNPWLSKLVGSFCKEYAENGVDLVFLPDKKIKTVEFDSSKLRIVISNLLSNALKFSHAGSTVKVSTRLIGTKVNVSVCDQGIGLGNVDKNLLFSRFYQGKHNQTGNGIGLAYSKELVELHNGRIWADDNPEGGGAVFCFDIPACENDDCCITEEDYGIDIGNITVDNNNTSQDNSLIQEELKQLCSSYSILIVEDNNEFRHFIKKVLKDYFKNVYSADNGQEGLNMTLNKRPDVIVSDVMMPVMNGFEMCRRIKSDLTISLSLVILLTAVGDVDHVATGYKLGADFYISKPFEPDVLIRLIYNQLKNREVMRKHYAESTRIFMPDITTSYADETFLNNLNKHISEHINDPDFSINTLLQYICVGRTTLFQKVKALTGMSVNDYINKIRINRAITLLETTDHTISDIADMVGFSYQCHFSTTFKQITGMTPTQYRQKKKDS